MRFCERFVGRTSDFARDSCERPRPLCANVFQTVIDALILTPKHMGPDTHVQALPRATELYHVACMHALGMAC
jgi:hypothetical protein